MLYGGEVSEQTGIALWMRAAEHFIRLGVKNVVVTLAAQGTYYATTNGEQSLVGAENTIKVVDTTGAGYVATLDTSSASVSKCYILIIMRNNRYICWHLCS